MSPWGPKLQYLLLCLSAVFFSTVQGATYDYAHGISYLEPLKYPADFTHFKYVNSDAPKGGLLRAGEMGTYDSFNNILDKGRVAAGVDFLGTRQLLYDRLLEEAKDEPASYYGRLASGVWVADDLKQFAFRIRDGARWHDGEPLTIEDVIWTFRTFKEVGSAGIRTALRDLESIEKIGADEVLFTTRASAEGNHNLLFAVGSFPILPKHYWESRDITSTTLDPPLGSGPYRFGKVDIGRYVFLERVKDYWGRDLPVNRGRYNYDTIKVDYFRDENIMVEALKGDVIDVRSETVSKIWVKGYDFPPLHRGYFKKELVKLSRPWGLWWPVLWNLDRKRFQDVRVREALWLLSPFHWTNRVLMHNFYDYAKSFFYNSKMASSGLPSQAELELLEPWRGKIPDRVFTHEWKGIQSDGYGYDRENLKRSLELFAEAGWQVRDGVLTNVETGEPFTVDFVFVSPYALRQEGPLIANMNLVGIETTARAPEISNWLYRMREGKFDGGVYAFIPSYTPGLMLRNRLSSASAESPAGQNWGNIRDPAVDAMIEHILAARTPEDFYAATRALDRILLWNFYYIPGLGVPGYRLVHWDRFGIPENRPPLQDPVWYDTWWYDEEKANRVEQG
ncbi:MAG: ABC transporter substrate-binding protein, partial [Pseudomonadales bacterium]|nr:ABC transporter substrate-binding protein [Pseudomonadales bacterium]